MDVEGQPNNENNLSEAEEKLEDENFEKRAPKRVK